VHWIVSRNILLIHELSHGLENANENAQIKLVFFFNKIPCNSYLIASTHLRLKLLQGFCSSQREVLQIYKYMYRVLSLRS
jgi:hypothetical protein